MADPTVIGADISRLVQNSPNHKLPGSALAVLLKRGYPDFRPEDFGCRNLREFIRTYAKEVFEDGKNGGDIRYSVPSIGETTSRQDEFRTISSLPSVSRKLFVETAVWKTFVSPTAPYRIYANRESAGEFRVMHAHESAPAGAWIVVPACPPETHVQIAKEFIEGLADESIKDQLTKILGLDCWWNHFYFSAKNFGVERQWSAFRRRRLHAEFEKALKSLGIPLPLAHQPIPLILPVAAPALPLRAEPETDSRVRRVAAAVLRRLSDAELREVWLPLGAVLDELGER